MRKDLRWLVSVLVTHAGIAGAAGCSGQPLTVANDGGNPGSSGSSTTGAGSGSSTSSGGAGSGMAMSGAGGGGSGVATSGGGGGSGAATSGGQGGSGSVTSGTTGGSGSATSGTTGGSGSATTGTGGEVDAGGGAVCSATRDCSGGEVCGFPRIPVCGTKGLCFKPEQIECLVYQAGCACDGTEISITCNGLPAGYDTKPLRHTGPCKDGG